jgi:hypothetical protein
MWCCLLRNMKSAVLMAVLGLFLATPLLAQSGKISGKVVDGQSRQALPGVNVVIDGTTLGAATDSDGDYFIINIPPGRYTVQASMVGYAIQSRTEVLVQTDRTVVIDFEMGSEALMGEEVTISAEHEVIQMDVSGSATTMEAEEFTSAPIVQVADYLQIQEGLDYASTADGKWLSIRGGYKDETDFMVDGVSTMNANMNSAYMSVSKTAIKEVSIQTGGFNAEYGRVRSGLVNVVTRDGSREEYSVALDGQYSFPHLKHFGRNLFDRYGSFYNGRIDSKNDPFQPGTFSNGSFQPKGDAQPFGLRGEMTLDPTHPGNRGFAYVGPENEGDLGHYTDGSGTAYTAEEMAQWGMEPIMEYPDYFGFAGWQSISDQLAGSASIHDDLSSTELAAEWMVEHQGFSYGHKPDYNTDVTVTGPMPGNNMNNRLGELLEKSTFMLSFRQQTARMVFPVERRSFKDRNLQAKITTSITPQTKLRLNVLYGSAYSVQQQRNTQFNTNWLNNNAFYLRDRLAGSNEQASGIRGGLRISGDLGKEPRQLFNEGQHLQAANYTTQFGAKLTHTVSPSTYFELEYMFAGAIDNAHPVWPTDYDTARYWIFNMDGMNNPDGSPRTFITNQAEDIFPNGVAQRLDPISKEMWDEDPNGLSGLPANQINARNRPFATENWNTWAYSRDLVSQWFDEQRTSGSSRKGPNRLNMARGYDAEGEFVPWTDPTLLPGSWDFNDVHNHMNHRDLTQPQHGGLMDGPTLPGYTLVHSMHHPQGHWAGQHPDREGVWILGNNGRQNIRSNSYFNGGRANVVSQITKHNQIKAGVDFKFWRVSYMEVYNNQSRGVNLNESDQYGLFDIKGVQDNNWQQFHDNPFELSAFIQDKIEVQGLIANLGLRMDTFDPTTNTIDFADPYRAEFANAVGRDDGMGADHWGNTTDWIKARPKFKFSPRLGLSFPVTETSKVYFNYGWFWQRPSMQQYFMYHSLAPLNNINPNRIPNANLDWPRTIQMEMGYEQNVKGWFLVHAAGYFKDSDNLIDSFLWENYTGDQRLLSTVNNNYSDIRGLEFRVDKNYGLIRARLVYNYMLRSRGQSGAQQQYEDLIKDLSLQENTLRQIEESTPNPTSNFRGTLGFFTPRNWGPTVMENIHPLDNVMINMIYRLNDPGQRRHIVDAVSPERDIWVPIVMKSNTDLRAEKRIGIGRRMNLGLFIQVYNLWNQKTLVGPNGNAGIDATQTDDYDNAFRYDTKYGASTPPGNDKWGEYKPQHLSETLPWFWDGLLFEDKRDVFYGLTFSFN